jgi:hypothetical protein
MRSEDQAREDDIHLSNRFCVKVRMGCSIRQEAPLLRPKPVGVRPLTGCRCSFLQSETISTETLYRVRPFDEPKLIKDYFMAIWSPPRTVERRQWVKLRRPGTPAISPNSPPIADLQLTPDRPKGPNYGPRVAMLERKIFKPDQLSQRSFRVAVKRAWRNFSRRRHLHCSAHWAFLSRPA